MPLLGLTGGIASGKSTVSNRLRALGALIVDADAISRELAAPEGQYLSRLREAFGNGILNDDGTLNRSALADFIFSDPDKRRLLDSITHPEIISRMWAAANGALKRNADCVVVMDAPLLIETGMHRHMDWVWVVTAPRDTRINRLMLRDGLTAEQAKARVESQIDDSERLRYATHELNNSGSASALVKLVDTLWHNIIDIQRQRGCNNSSPNKEDICRL